MKTSITAKKLFVLLGLAATVCLLAGCESMDWQQARRQNSIPAYEKFIAKHPHGKFREPAEKKLDDLSFRKARERGTFADLNNYLTKFPRGRYASEVASVLRNMLKGRIDNLTPLELETVRITFRTTMGPFTIRLRPDKAPTASRNLLLLAASRFYKGLFINRVEPNRLVLMGDPRGTGRGGPGYFLPAEINDLKLTRGMVAMRSLPDDPDTVGSQFFVALTALPEMDGKHTVFAEVTDGIEVLDKISQVPAAGPRQQFPGRPRQLINIEKVTVLGIDLFDSARQAQTKEDPGISEEDEMRLLNGESVDMMEEPTNAP